jgi:hypothetical protein
MDQIWKSIAQHIEQAGSIHHRAFWASALACFLITYFCARRIDKDPRLFTVLALFAGAWVLVMAGVDSRVQTPGSTPVADRAFDVASFLLVFSGTMLAREAPPGHRLLTLQKWIQVAALWLLFVLVVPSQLPIKLPLSYEQIELVIGEVLSAVGFLALALGTRAVARGPLFWLLVIVVAVYECLSLSRTIEIFTISPGTERPFMDTWELYSFIAMRFLLTGLYCYVVVTAFHQTSLGVTGDAPSEVTQGR